MSVAREFLGGGKVVAKYHEFMAVNQEPPLMTWQVVDDFDDTVTALEIDLICAVSPGVKK